MQGTCRAITGLNLLITVFSVFSIMHSSGLLFGHCVSVSVGPCMGVHGSMALCGDVHIGM